jgi:hypothetical protein
MVVAFEHHMRFDGQGYPFLRDNWTQHPVSHAEGGPITPTREGRGTNEQADLSMHDHQISWVGTLQVVVIEGRATTKVRAVLDGHSPFGRPNPGPSPS